MGKMINVAVVERRRGAEVLRLWMRAFRSKPSLASAFRVPSASLSRRGTPGGVLSADFLDE